MAGKKGSSHPHLSWSSELVDAAAGRQVGRRAGKIKIKRNKKQENKYHVFQEAIMKREAKTSRGMKSVEKWENREGKITEAGEERHEEKAEMAKKRKI